MPKHAEKKWNTNKPEIKVILEKKTLAIEDVISFIKTMNLEIRDITQYYMMITEIRLINRSHMEEEYLDDEIFSNEDLKAILDRFSNKKTIH